MLLEEAWCMWRPCGHSQGPSFGTSTQVPCAQGPQAHFSSAEPRPRPLGSLVADSSASNHPPVLLLAGATSQACLSAAPSPTLSLTALTQWVGFWGEPYSCCVRGAGQGRCPGCTGATLGFWLSFQGASPAPPVPHHHATESSYTDGFLKNIYWQMPLENSDTNTVLHRVYEIPNIFMCFSEKHTRIYLISWVATSRPRGLVSVLKDRIRRVLLAGSCKERKGNVSPCK